MPQLDEPPNDWSPDQWRRTVVEYIATHPDRPLKSKPLARELNIPDDQYAQFRALLREMVEEGALVLGPGRRLEVPEKSGQIIGIFRATRRGFGFLQVVDQPNDIFIPEEATADALDGDTVAVRLLKARKKGEPPSAEIVRIIERGLLRWVGRLEQIGRRWIVRPQGRTPAPLVEIADPTAKSARPGDLVVVEPLDRNINATQIRGVIIESLGPPTQTQALMRAVIRRHSVPEEFPDAVRREAQAASSLLTPEEWGTREDLRRITTITIDPVDARDFDDAISVESFDNGHYELGVHIADVAHFVPVGGALDREARARGNSTYVPQFVVPMLPEVLSNGVCSLQPNVERLTKSVFIEYNQKGEPQRTRCANSVISSHMRLTYEQASAALAGQPGELDGETLDLLTDAEDLARRIQRRRRADGMIVLTLPEVALEFDAHGRIANSGPADNSFSHTLIEMFMVEANEAVCRLLVKEHIPHIRRVHPPPGEEAARTLRQLSYLMGKRLPDILDRAIILNILAAVHGKPEEMAVNYVLLRSMSQAVYSPALEGHFALASKHYTHFTSPIRRYADLTIHRLLDGYLRKRQGQPPPGGFPEPPSLVDLALLGKAISATERRSQLAERDAKSALLLQLMEKKIGETLDGVITSVTKYGAFVQIRPYLAEGLIRIGDLGDERWTYDDEAALLYGQRSGRVIALGQKVRVRIVAVDDVRQELLLAPDSRQPLGVARGGRSILQTQVSGSKSRPAKKGGDQKSGKKSRARSHKSPAKRKRRRVR